MTVIGNFDVDISMTTVGLSGTSGDAERPFLAIRDPLASAGEDWVLIGKDTFWGQPGNTLYLFITNNSESGGRTTLYNYLRVTNTGDKTYRLYGKVNSGDAWTYVSGIWRQAFHDELQIGIMCAQGATSNGYTLMVDYFQGTYTVKPPSGYVVTQKGALLTDTAIGGARYPVVESLQLAAITNLSTCAIIAALDSLTNHHESAILQLTTNDAIYGVNCPVVKSLLSAAKYDVLKGESAVQAAAYQLYKSLNAVLNARYALGVNNTGCALYDVLRGINHMNAAIVELTNPVNCTCAIPYAIDPAGIQRILAAMQDIDYAVDPDTGLPETIRYQSIEGAAEGSTWDIRVDGQSIKAAIENVSISIKDSEKLLHVEINFIDMSWYDKCNPLDDKGTERIEVELKAILYSFLLEDRNRTESVDNSGALIEAFSIWGRSRGALLTEDYTTSVVQKYEDNAASEIADDLAGDVPVNWGCEDYNVKTYTPNGYPLDGLVELAEAIGAIVVSAPDGTLIIRPEFPIRPKDLNQADFGCKIDDDNMFSLDLSYEQPQYSSVQVKISSDSEDISFVIEEDASCAKIGGKITVKIYPSKTGAGYKVSVPGGVTATKIASAAGESPEETVTISAGKASVKYPIWSVASYHITGCDGAKSMTWTPGSKDLLVTDAKCSVVKINYTTRYDAWEISSAVEIEGIGCVTLADDGAADAITVFMGRGDKSAEAISKNLITTERMATVVGAAYLDKSYYLVSKYRLSVPYIGLLPGAIVGVHDRMGNRFVRGIVRQADINIVLDNNALWVKQGLEVYVYDESNL
jgi:hypothetical protein